MARDARFWRNVTIIALLHVVLLLAFIRWNRQPKKALTSNIVWMSGGAGSSADAVPQKKSAPQKKEAPAQTPEIKHEVKREEAQEEEEKPILTAAKSDIQLSTPTPKPSATPTPESTATPKPKPSPQSTPKPTPKPTPKKKLLAKASPKPKKENDEEEGEETKKKKEVAKTALAKKESDKVSEAGDSEEKPVKKAVAAHSSKKTGSGGTDGGNSEGSGGASEFGWYGNMLHDRFYSEWIQPTTSVPAGAKISALVKIRIEKDGSISDFKIVKPSGISVVDESVEAVAKQVTQVDPLPAGLGSSGHYDVNINFEFNPGE